MAGQHVFVTDVIRHAHDVRTDDVCVECGERRDSKRHVTGYVEPPNYRSFRFDLSAWLDDFAVEGKSSHEIRQDLQARIAELEAKS